MKHTVKAQEVQAFRIHSLGTAIRNGSLVHILHLDDGNGLPGKEILVTPELTHHQGATQAGDYYVIHSDGRVLIERKAEFERKHEPAR